jgi:hypothetical protein
MTTETSQTCTDCRITNEPDYPAKGGQRSYTVALCPLHAHAEELLEALERARCWFEDNAGLYEARYGSADVEGDVDEAPPELVAAINDAIAAAKGDARG